MSHGNTTMTDWNARRPDDAPAEHETAADSGSTEEAKIAALVEALSKESADYKDRLLRTLADMENLRRRTDREVSESRAYGIASFARDLVGVADNMRRALESARDGSADAKTLVDGVELTERELLKVLDKHG